MIHEAAEHVVDHALLFEGHADAPDDAADDLAARGLRVQDLAGRDRVHDPGDANDAEVLVDLTSAKIAECV